MQGTKFQSLVGELKSQMLHSEAKRNKVVSGKPHRGKKALLWSYNPTSGYRCH